MRRVQDLAWPGQMFVGAGMLAVAAILVALVLSVVARTFFLVDESRSGVDPVSGVSVEVADPEPVISESG